MCIYFRERRKTIVLYSGIHCITSVFSIHECKHVYDYITNVSLTEKCTGIVMPSLFSGYLSSLPERQSSQSVKPIKWDLSNDEISNTLSFLPVACTWYTEPEITLSQHLHKYLYSCSESCFRPMLCPSQSRAHLTGGWVGSCWPAIPQMEI